MSNNMVAEASSHKRIPISLRLPATLVNAVESYADSEHISKTDAFIHFLQRGLSYAQESSNSTLDSIEQQLSEILRIVRSEHTQEHAENPELRAIKQAIVEAAQLFPAIRRAYLFGSLARGTYRKDSDIDIRIELDPNTLFNLHDLEHFAKHIERATEREVDVISAATIKNEQLARAIEQEKVLVYERKAG